MTSSAPKQLGLISAAAPADDGLTFFEREYFDSRDSSKVATEAVGASLAKPTNGRKPSKDSNGRRPSKELAAEAISPPKDSSDFAKFNAAAKRRPSKDSGAGGRRPSKDLGAGGRRPSKDSTGGRKSSKESNDRKPSKESNGGALWDAIDGSGDDPTADDAVVEEPVVHHHIESARTTQHHVAQQSLLDRIKAAHNEDPFAPTPRSDADSPASPPSPPKEVGGRKSSKEANGRRPSKDNNGAISGADDAAGRQQSKEPGARRPSKESVEFASDSGGGSTEEGEDFQQWKDSYLESMSPRKQDRGSKRSSSKDSVGRRPSKDALSRVSQLGRSMTGPLSGLLSQRSMTGMTQSQRRMSVATEGTTMLESSLFMSQGAAPSQDPKKERLFVRQRRGEVKQRRSMYEWIDDEIDSTIKKTTDVSCCLQICGLSTNSSQSPNTTLVEISHKAGDGLERRYGLADFGATGFYIAPPAEVEWADLNVRHVLDLQLAVHRKTSIERLCFQLAKSKVPISVGNDQMLKLAQNLKGCDHVNILNCLEVCEDDEYIYFLYEHLSCVTLLSVLEKHTWTEEEIVNLVRECIAAVGYCNGMGLNHLGWTLSHVLLPDDCLQSSPRFAKLYGFGLTGISQTPIVDFFCWAPEALESLNKYGLTFATRMEPSQKSACDMWSLGTVIYAVVARRPPILGSSAEVQKHILAKTWTFGVAFDAVDSEAKALVESLMQSHAKIPVKAEHALFNPWIRRRWKPPPNGAANFQKLEKFCGSSLAKRMFGRFLVKFLDAGHMSQVTTAFYSLDSQGYGTIDARDLKAACKLSDRHPSAVTTITGAMCTGGVVNISCARFSESMAEEVIDGRALRHSFESLDDDGSGCISPEELFDELKAFSSELTIEDIIAHIAETEVAVGDAGAVSDHKLDYAEYMQLFPGRMRQVKGMVDRIDSTREYAKVIEAKFLSVKEQVNSWHTALSKEANSVLKLSQALERDSAHEFKEIKRKVAKIAQMLSHPPGPYDFQRQMQIFQSQQKKNKKKSSKEVAISATEYGFDSFLQDHAIHSFWPVLLDGERKMIRHSYHTDNTGQGTVDVFKAADTINFVVKKVDEVLEWTKHQVEEYECIVDILLSTESPIHDLVYSSRGLQAHAHNVEADDEGG